MSSGNDPIDFNDLDFDDIEAEAPYPNFELVPEGKAPPYIPKDTKNPNPRHAEYRMGSRYWSEMQDDPFAFEGEEAMSDIGWDAADSTGGIFKGDTGRQPIFEPKDKYSKDTLDDRYNPLRVWLDEYGRITDTISDPSSPFYTPPDAFNAPTNRTSLEAEDNAYNEWLKADAEYKQNKTPRTLRKRNQALENYQNIRDEISIWAHGMTEPGLYDYDNQELMGMLSEQHRQMADLNNLERLTDQEWFDVYGFPKPPNAEKAVQDYRIGTKTEMRIRARTAKELLTNPNTGYANAKQIRKQQMAERKILGKPFTPKEMQLDRMKKLLSRGFAPGGKFGDKLTAAKELQSGRGKYISEDAFKHRPDLKGILEEYKALSDADKDYIDYLLDNSFMGTYQDDDLSHITETIHYLRGASTPEGQEIFKAMKSPQVSAETNSAYNKILKLGVDLLHQRLNK